MLTCKLQNEIITIIKRDLSKKRTSKCKQGYRGDMLIMPGFVVDGYRDPYGLSHMPWEIRGHLLGP